MPLVYYLMIFMNYVFHKAGIMSEIICHEAKRFVEKFSIFFIIYTYWMQDEVLLAVMKGLNFILLNKNEVFCKVPKN